MLAGELQNSSFSSSKYMAEAWPKLSEANINTVLGSVSWEQIEPEEGKFDFTELDECLRGARQHDIRLVLLWFGSFKNGGWNAFGFRLERGPAAERSMLTIYA
jgi:beta-galactosidase GanA